MKLPRYSVGVGDRFSHQGRAQLRAVMRAAHQGVEITPVWNKSHREHRIIGTNPSEVRREADEAVHALGWEGPYFVDADHIGRDNVELFLEASDYFTLDVADFIGQAAHEEAIRSFVTQNTEWTGKLKLTGSDQNIDLTPEKLEEFAREYLLAVREAGRIYRLVEREKGPGNFVTEVSMDETDRPQSPEELMVILLAIADEGIPAQTIAPRFTGRFNKGVDYEGEVGRFGSDLNAHLAVIALAVERLGLSENLKLSIHSGSDKFSLYGPVRDALKKHDAGLHIKTAGTTWLEELIGLALAGDDGLRIAKDIYRRALDRKTELCEPYSTVVDIDPAKLPSAEEVESWNGEQYARALRHEESCPRYNPDLRQLLHVAYKIAAEMGEQYYAALRRHQQIIGQKVTDNLYERHLRPLFC